MSTLRSVMPSFEHVISASFFKDARKAFSASFFSVKSISSTWPVILSVRILVLAKFRILQIVDVDSLFLPLKILIPSILLINVDLPALVSPEIELKAYTYTNAHTNTSALIFLSSWIHVKKICFYAKPSRNADNLLLTKKDFFGLFELLIPAITIPWSTLSISFILFSRIVK